MSNDAYRYPVILSPEEKDCYFTLTFPDLDITYQHIYCEDLYSLHKTASALILKRINEYKAIEKKPPSATPISKLRIRQGCSVYNIDTQDVASIYVSSGEKPKPTRQYIFKKYFVYLTFAIGFISYFIGWGFIFAKFFHNAAPHPYVFGTLFLILFTAPLIALSAGLSKCGDLKKNDDHLLLYLSTAAIPALVAGFGLYSALAHFNAPAIICWPLSILLVISLLIVLPSKDT